jgi:hypothetical protein
MSQLNRKEMEAVYRMFDTFALEDQRRFYESAVGKYRKSAFQVNTYRAFFSLLTGLASALAGVLVATAIPAVGCVPGDTSCAILSGAVIVLLILSVVAPAIGGAFGVLADLYQWDRLVTVYSNALENIEVADSRSPDDEMEDMKFRASLAAYVDGTLSVMRDESAQWGQLIRTPPQIEKFLEAEQEKADKASGQQSGNSSAQAPAAPVSQPPASAPVSQPPAAPPPQPPAAAPMASDATTPPPPVDPNDPTTAG